jgi:hypothetical protein
MSLVDYNKPQRWNAIVVGRSVQHLVFDAREKLSFSGA